MITDASDETVRLRSLARVLNPAAILDIVLATEERRPESPPSPTTFSQKPLRTRISGAASCHTNHSLTCAGDPGMETR